MPAIGDVARVTIRYVAYSQVFVNVLHFVNQDDTKDLDDLLADFLTVGVPNIVNAIRGAISDQIVLTDLKAEWVESADTTFTIAVINQPGLLTGGIGGMSSATCAVLSLRTVLVGRSNRGRIYLPFTSVGSIEENTGLFSIAYLNILNTLRNTLMAPFGLTEDWRLIVWSPTRRAAEGPSYIPREIDHILIDPVPRTQRRRQIAVGG